ncbi:MAG: hypothetical protein P8099_03620 [Gemmatimonadota bacterium]|jgi:hypothetical protein
MELILSLACDSARVRPDGKVDVAGIFNELYAPGFPAAQARMSVLFVLEWSQTEQGRYDFVADLVDDEGSKVLTIEGHTQVESRPAARAPALTRILLPLENVVFPHPGRYRFMLKVGGRERPAFALFVGEQVAEGADPTESARV